LKKIKAAHEGERGAHFEESLVRKLKGHLERPREIEL
jgi:hypothetical protein